MSSLTLIVSSDSDEDANETNCEKRLNNAAKKDVQPEPIYVISDSDTEQCQTEEEIEILPHYGFQPIRKQLTDTASDNEDQETEENDFKFDNSRQAKPSRASNNEDKKIKENNIKFDNSRRVKPSRTSNNEDKKIKNNIKFDNSRQVKPSYTSHDKDKKPKKNNKIELVKDDNGSDDHEEVIFVAAFNEHREDREEEQPKRRKRGRPRKNPESTQRRNPSRSTKETVTSPYCDKDGDDDAIVDNVSTPKRRPRSKKKNWPPVKKKETEKKVLPVKKTVKKKNYYQRIRKSVAPKQKMCSLRDLEPIVLENIDLLRNYRTLLPPGPSEFKETVKEIMKNQMILLNLTRM